MKPAVANLLCKVAGHPGLRKLAKEVRDSGRTSALLFWTCPRCAVEIRSIEVDVPENRRRADRPVSAYD